MAGKEREAELLDFPDKGSQRGRTIAMAREGIRRSRESSRRENTSHVRAGKEGPQPPPQIGSRVAKIEYRF